MARIRQFAKDMGLSYNKAKNLVNKGRKLKDGGSSVLESTMNKITPVKAKNGKFKNPGKAMTGQFKNIQNLAATGKLDRKKALKMIRELVKKNPMKKMKDGGEVVGATKGLKEAADKLAKVDRVRKVKEERKKKEEELRKKFKPDVERMRKDEKQQYLSGFTKSGEETKPLGRPKGSSKVGVLTGRRGKRTVRGDITKKMKMGGSFPDLSGDGKVTKKDVLIGRGVIKKSRGGGLAIQGTQFRGVR